MIYVTGGAGFIGKNLVNELIKLENQYPEFQDQNSPSKQSWWWLSPWW